jgi:putative FmdB family regulatory protein
MPIYEYQCKRCHHRFERIQKFSDPHVKKCPECGGPVEQLLSPPAVQFKGSGWYVTDYAKKAGKSSTPGDSGSPAESGTKAESGSKKEEKPKSEPKKSEKK